MRIIAIFCFLFFQALIQIQAQEIEIKASRLHGLVVFVFSNADRPHYSPFIKEFTDKSEYKNRLKKIIGDFSNIDKSLRQGTSYREEGKDYGDMFTVGDLLEVQSAHATDIDDLMTRLQHTMPLEDWLQLKDILKAADPIYEKLIWSVYGADLLAAEKTYKEKITEWRVQDLFNKAQIFYKATWPKSLKFTIALYPIPKGSTHSNAHSLSNFESVGVILGEKDVAGRFGVIFHEMMHSLYSAQPFEFKNKLLSFYNLNKNDSDKAYRAGAQKFSNEVFATLLGNGWFYETVTGSTDKTDWYNEHHINSLAHAMYDLTKKYLNTGKSLDQNYINSYILTFKKLYPDYGDDLSYVFENVEIIHTSRYFKSMEIKKHFRKNVRGSRSLGIGADSDLTLKPIQINPDGTTLLLLSSEEFKNLSSLARKNLEIPEDIYKKIQTSEFGLWKWTDKESNVRVIGIANKDELDKLFTSQFNKQ